MHVHCHVLLRCPHDECLHELLRLLPHLLGMGITRRLIAGPTDCADEMTRIAELTPQVLGPMVHNVVLVVEDLAQHGFVVVHEGGA
jgi:hypothetical protein